MGNDEDGNWRGYGYESNSDYWQRTQMESDARRNRDSNQPQAGCMLLILVTIFCAGCVLLN